MGRLHHVEIKTQNSPSVDAFGRFRVSAPDTLFDSKQIFDNQPLFWDESLEAEAASRLWQVFCEAFPYPVEARLAEVETP